MLLSHKGRFDATDKRLELASGPAGKLFAQALAGTGFSRYNIDIRTADEPGPFLSGTRVVLLCGSATLGTVGRRPEQLNALRGSPVVIENQPVYLPTYHPQDACDRQAYEQRLNPEYNDGEDADDTDDESVGKDHGATSRANYAFWFYSDIRKAVAISKSGLRRNNCNYVVCTNPEDAIDALEVIPCGTPFYLDIETDLETAQVTCLAFSIDARTVYSVPIYDWKGQLVGTQMLQALMLRALASAMHRASVTVCHNALFDLFILLWKYRIPPPRCIYDTMLAHHRMYTGREKSLGHCTAFYTQQPYHKDEGIFHPTNYTQWQQLLLYNCKDVETMALIHSEQASHARHLGAEQSIADGNRLIRPLLLKTYRGLLLNETEWCATIDELGAKTEWFEEKVLPRLAGKNLNPRSPDQVARWLYEDHTFPRPLGNDSLTGKRALYKLLNKYDLPLLRVILACRRWSKEAGQLRFRLWRGHYATCSYTLCKVKTHRLSSRALLSQRGKKGSGWGTNLQNWNKKTRRLVIPHPGNVFVQVDQAGAEAKIVAYYCPKGSRYRDLFIYGIKPHTYLALFLFRQVWETALGESLERFLCSPIATLREQPRWKELEALVKASDDAPPSQRYYFMSKCTCHSGNYGVGEREFVMSILERSEGQVVIPLREGERFLATYRKELFPEIETGYQAYVRQCVYRDRVLRNAFGYPFHIMVDAIDDRKFKEYLAWIAQSTVGTITNLADTEMQERIDDKEYKDFAILQNNHDSLLLETPIGNEVNVARIAQQHMNRRMVNPWGEEYFMGSEASVGPNWYEMKGLKI